MLNSPSHGSKAGAKLQHYFDTAKCEGSFFALYIIIMTNQVSYLTQNLPVCRKPVDTFQFFLP